MMDDIHDLPEKDVENISPQDFELNISPKDFELEEEFQEYLKDRPRKYLLFSRLLGSDMAEMFNIVEDECERRRFNNIKAGRELCKHCDGTGDGGIFMYSKCTECGRRGY